MGKRRRQLLSKKFRSLPWNRFNTDNEQVTIEPVIIPEVVTPIVEPQPTIEFKEKPNFKGMTKKDLVKFAKENDIEIKTSMTKAKIIEILEQS